MPDELNDTFEHLKKKRAGLHSTITQHEGRLAQYLQFKDECDVVAKLKVIQRLNDDIGLVADKLINYCSGDQIAQILMETSEAQSRTEVLSFKLNELRTKLKPQVVAPVRGTGTESGVSLVKLQLPVFEGDPLRYQEFKDAFDVAVDKNPRLTGSQKLTYLKAYLTGEASAALEGWDNSEANYPVCLKYLEERFGDVEMRKDALGARLVDCEPVKVENPRDMRKLLDTAQSAIRSLETLGLKEEELGFWCRLILIRKIPASCYKEFQRCYKKAAERTLDNLLKFLQEEVSIWERVGIKEEQCAAQDTPKDVQEYSKHLKPLREKPSTSRQTMVVDVKESCVFCSKTHGSVKCALSREEKFDVARKKRLCLNCLKPGHFSLKCRSSSRCPKCQRKHHDVFHRSEDEMKVAKVSIINPGKAGEPLRQVVSARVVGPNESKVVRALLDDGSTATFVSQSVAAELGLKRVRKQLLELTTFGSAPKRVEVDVVELNLATPLGKLLKTPAYVCDSTSVIQEKLRWEPWLQEAAAKGMKPSDAFVGDSVSDSVDVIFGCDVYDEVVTGQRQVLPSGVAAVETIFGWAFRGSASALENGKGLARSSISLIKAVQKDESEEEVKELIKRFVAAETLPPEEDSPSDAVSFMSAFKEEVRFVDGRYEVPLLWKGDARPACNVKQAVSQFKRSKARLEEAAKWPEYVRIFKEYEDFGAIEEDPEEEAEGYYLPHHAVLRPESTTHPVRIVFNGSAVSSNGLSLNSCLEIGPNLLPHVDHVIITFRSGPVGVTGDLRKAFFTVSVRQEDRKFLKLAWDEPRRMARVPFGASCSPCLLIAVIHIHFQKLYEERKVEFETYKILMSGLYMDNITGSMPDIEVDEFKEVTTQSFDSAGMSVHQWRISGRDCEEGDESKVLGVGWNSKEDILYTLPPKDKPCGTKREFLAFIAGLFDPMGFVSPVVVRGKIILQELWKAGKDWDDLLDEDVRKRIDAWKEDVARVNEVKLPRFLAVGGTLEMHIFVDASEKAYGAVAYLVQTGIGAQLVMAKSRVAPVKFESIPRLELMAAVEGAKLAKHLQRHDRLAGLPVLYWSDSTIVLAWIKPNPRRWGVFVANRVAQIQALTDADAWSHVPGTDNPADLVSRGADVRVVMQEGWTRGPSWLPHRGEWPRPVEIPPTDVELKKSAIKESVATVEVEEDLFDKVSKWMLLVRSCAWILRWRFPSEEKGDLTHDEVTRAEVRVIRMIQEKVFRDEVKQLQEGKSVSSKSRLSQLTPFLDKETGLLRVGGRLRNVAMTFDMKHPLILPSEHRWVRLLVEALHVRLLHGGVDLMESEWRQRFWILAGRRLARSVKRACVTCRRYNQLPVVDHPFAPLPQDRVTLSRGFAACGVDYAGPFYVRLEGKQVGKVYLLLFVCAATRAVHLEVVDSQSVKDFVLAFRRFTARRGTPSLLRSDNAKTFIKCASLLPLEWRFNPPLAPWWGGAYERLVRTIKTPLKKVIGRALLKRTEFETICVQVEGVVNSRPLLRMSDEVAQPLTPAMLLGHVLSESNPAEEGLIRDQLTRRQRHIEKVWHQLRKRFMGEYVTKLAKQAARIPSKSRSRTIEPGEICFLTSVPGGGSAWPLVRVETVYPGPDGTVRVVKLKTASGKRLTRAVQHLVPLELDVDERPVRDQGDERPVRGQRDKRPGRDQEQKEEVRGVVPQDPTRGTRSGRIVRRPKRYQE